MEGGFYPGKRPVNAFFDAHHFFLFALGHGRLRGHSVVNVRLYYRVRLQTTIYGRLRSSY
jgi:hypothetical protein